MPIRDRDDAVEVRDRIRRIFTASASERADEIRGLFVEVLDFNPAEGYVSLAAARRGTALPDSAARVAELNGVHVLYISLETDETVRVRKAAADAAARLISEQLGDDLLLVFSNTSVSHLHFIHPDFAGARPTLRRMIVERDLPHRTSAQQVASIYWKYRESESIRTALDEAFDVEPVTREFFREYKRIFDAAEAGVTGFGAGDDELESRRMYVQTLFNRLMFVYFLQRKGWLTFRGNSDYLNALWNYYQATPDQTNFYKDRLVPLFFSGLNNPQSSDLNRNDPELYSLIGAPPFLNGGLFDQADLDRRPGIAVPDSAIGTILSDLFDRFNFTVMESTPFDIEVAVDPEMLGKVFEELVTGRNESGAYYTPRPVVSFMCREALKGYLEGQDTGLPTEAITAFVDDRDTSDIPVQAAGSVSRALDEITVVDPACGSGAYLLGMMQELVDLQSALYSEHLRASARDLYNLKLHVIQRNLYGVDIDEFAVNIAMLRLWLSLAIEYEGETPDPLPNLDFKIVKGDSLLGPDPSPEEYADLFRHQTRTVAARLADLKRQHTEAIGSEKDALKREVESVEAELTAALADSQALEGAVDWRVQFAEVFDRGGFDVVVANPPYIRLQKDGGKLGNRYKGLGYATYVQTGDVYQLFYERGCQLLRSSQGLLAYITSNSWLRAEYGKSLRRYFSEKHTPMSLLELGKDVFESAIVDSSVLLLCTGSANGAFRAVDMDTLPNGNFPPEEELWGQIRPSGDAPWSILSHLEQSVMDKMLTKGTTLRDWDVKINYGIKTGYNPAFIIDDNVRQALILEDPKSDEIIKPILRGRDVQRYQANWAGKWLIDTHNGYGNYPAVDIEDYPAVKTYLDGFYPQLERRQDKGKTPYNLRNCTYHDEFTKDKLFWMDLTARGRFAISSGEMFCVNSAYVLTGAAIKYLCAVLNSSLTTWFMKNTALNSGMGVTRWVRFTVERVPIPEITSDRQQPFVLLVDEILGAKACDPNVDTSHLEWEIDRLVYDLYGLTEEEDTAIERSLGLIHTTDDEEDAALVRMMLEDRTGVYVSRDVVMETLRTPHES